MPKTPPALDGALLLPPVAPERHHYFENHADHPFEASATEPSLRNAWWLAECSLAAYADIDLARTIFSLGGLKIAGDSPIIGTRYGGQCYVVSNDEAIIVAFRGSQVVKTEHLASVEQLHDTVKKVLRDVVTDAKIRLIPWTGRADGMVHQGFSDSLHELLPEVIDRITQLNAEKPGRTLWVTGHSLGAALATLAADRLENVHGTHTFGSPRVGDETFANDIKINGWRFRHHTDAVAWMPPETMGYAHIPAGRYFDRADKLRGEPSTTGLILDGLAGAPGALQDSLSALTRGEWAALTPQNLNDHAPIYYAILTWNAYVQSGVS